jgi:hypothetical protein
MEIKRASCEYCGKELTEASRSTRKYCDDKCRKRNFNKVSADKRRESNRRYRSKRTVIN